jgi:hypothetical protein
MDDIFVTDYIPNRNSCAATGRYFVVLRLPAKKAPAFDWGKLRHSQLAFNGRRGTDVPCDKIGGEVAELLSKDDRAARRRSKKKTAPR